MKSQNHKYGKVVENGLAEEVALGTPMTNVKFWAQTVSPRSNADGKLEWMDIETNPKYTSPNFILAL